MGSSFAVNTEIEWKYGENAVFRIKFSPEGAVVHYNLTEI